MALLSVRTFSAACAQEAIPEQPIAPEEEFAGEQPIAPKNNL